MVLSLPSASRCAIAPYIVAIVAITACAPVTPTIPAAPAPKPPITGKPASLPPASASPTPTVPAVRTGSWQFAYAPGSYSYAVVTDAQIATLEDSLQKRAVPTLNQRATITIAPGGDVQVTDPVVTTTSGCDVTASLVTRMQALVPRLPARLIAGDTWTDSTTTSGCHGSIPATSHVTSVFTVIGDTTFAGTPALQIHRDDTIAATGEGVDGQHRILITANGTGTTELFFDPAVGHFLGAMRIQHSTINVTTSGKTTQFLQTVTDRVSAAQ